jgi:hypothetical protein
MGRFSKYWPWWARTVWLLSGKPPKDFDARPQELMELEYRIMDAELDLIERQHHLNGVRAQYTYLKGLMT